MFFFFSLLILNFDQRSRTTNYIMIYRTPALIKQHSRTALPPSISFIAIQICHVISHSR